MQSRTVEICRNKIQTKFSKNGVILNEYAGLTEIFPQNYDGRNVNGKRTDFCDSHQPVPRSNGQCNHEQLS